MKTPRANGTARAIARRTHPREAMATHPLQLWRLLKFGNAKGITTKKGAFDGR